MARSPFGTDIQSDEADENVSFQTALMACLVRHNGFADLPPENVPVEYRHGLLGCFDMKQRFGIEMPYLKCYSGDTIRALQVEVLRQFPHWTIILLGNCEVMSDRVATKDGHRIDDIDQYMDSLRAAEMELRDRSEGVVERQYQWLKPRIPPLALQLTEGKKSVIAGVFDRVSRKEIYYAVWLLSASPVSDFYIDTPGHEPCRGGGYFPVDADGTVHRQTFKIVNGERESIDAPFALFCWYVPKEYSGDKLEIVSDADGLLESVPFNRSEVVADSSLPRVELP